VAVYAYRGIARDGSPATGTVEAADRIAAIASVRRLGAAPLELTLAETVAAGAPTRIDAKARRVASAIIGELAVLLAAGLQLDRALALALENVEDPKAAAQFVEILKQVREGELLSRAMAARGALFSSTAVAMAEAGEANGRLGDALARLSEMLQRTEELKRIVGNAMIYPIALLVIAVGVVLMMLLFVVPQFESLFATSRAQLPQASLAVMAASRFLRDYGWWLLGALIAGGFMLRIMLRSDGARARADGIILRVPQLGVLVQRIETARLARTLGALLEGDVALPNALLLSQRAMGNRVMADAIGRVALSVREGGALTAHLAAANVLPRLALGFFRTGEETSQLGPMLSRLADVLDRDVRLRLERLIGIATPAITVVLGTTVAAIIASIMSAILGFNDLAVS